MTLPVPKRFTFLTRPALARVPPAMLVFLGSIALFLLLTGLLAWNTGKLARGAKAPLLVYCAAGVLPPVETAAREYEKTHGVTVQLQPGPSQTLLANIEITRRGDLYVPADDSFIQLARSKHLVTESFPLARMTGVLAVRRGNPKNIHSFADLLREDVIVAQANPEAAAIGRLTRETLQQTGQWEELKRRTTVFKTTVNDVANDIKLGAVDAGFVWDAMGRQYPELEFVPMPALTNLHARVAIGMLTHSAQPEEALRFARHLAARDGGQNIWRRHGYAPAEAAAPAGWP